MKGIDISTWQTNVDYQKLKDDGIEFVIIRCGYGKNESQKDDMFEKHYEGCKKAGLKVGTYLYSYATSVENSIKEAENCLKFIKGKHFELPIFYDLEDKCILPLGEILITQCAIEFCKEIEKAGYKAGIYANLNWFTNYINVSKVKQYSLWVAQWNDKCTAKFDYDFWQYTSKGKVQGIEGNVDMNICYDESYKHSVDNLVNNSCLHCDIGTPKYCEPCYQLLIAENIKLKSEIESLKKGTNNEIKKGDYIIFKGTKDYNGTKLDDWVYNSKFNVIEIKGDRVVIGKGSVVTAGVNKKDCFKI